MPSDQFDLDDISIDSYRLISFVLSDHGHCDCCYLDVCGRHVLVPYVPEMYAALYVYLSIKFLGTYCLWINTSNLSTLDVFVDLICLYVGTYLMHISMYLSYQVPG